jgi:predicted NAD/FAD-binding protein
LTISAAEADRIKFCFIFCAVEHHGAVDSFSTVYQRVITSPADSAEIKKLSRPLRERLTRNEALYRCATGWNNAICGNAK